MNLIKMLFFTICLLVGTAVQAQPNIVLIVTDDLDLNLFNRMYNENYLPNIRTHIGDRGTTFTNAFVTESLCCPSRATFFTGQYPHNHHVLDNKKPDGGVTLFNEFTALPIWLKNAGYNNGLVGKYLNGYGSDTTVPITSPENPLYIPKGWDFWRVLNNYDMYNYKMSQWDSIKKVARVVQHTTYQTDNIASMSVTFINNVATRPNPFFLYVAPFAPHVDMTSRTGCASELWNNYTVPSNKYLNTLPGYFTTLPQPPSFNEADMSDKSASMQTLSIMEPQHVECAKLIYQRRAESMRSVDDMVGVIVNALITNNVYDNTILVFISDNGYIIGEHRYSGKILGYEESIRIPLMVSGPNIPFSVNDKIVLNNDIAPTIAEWSNATPLLTVDGRSFVPLLQNSTQTLRKRFLVEYIGNSGLGFKFQAVRTGASDVVPNSYYAEWLDPTLFVEYYDLIADPFQLNANVVPVPGTLQQQLNSLKNCNMVGMPTCIDAEN